MSKLGFKHSEESKAKMRKSHIGLPLSDSHRKSLIGCRGGKPLSSEHKANIKMSRIGLVFTNSHKASISRSTSGPRHRKWIVGVPSKNKTLHGRIRKMYGKADHCESNTCSGNGKVFHWSNKRHDYKSLDRSDWQQLCSKCHHKYDVANNGKPVFGRVDS